MLCVPLSLRLCVPLSHYFVQGNRCCSGYKSNCNDCSSYGSCDGCNSGYTLSGGSCYTASASSSSSSGGGGTSSYYSNGGYSSYSSVYSGGYSGSSNGTYYPPGFIRGSPVGAIVGVVVGVLALAAIAVAVGIVMKKRHTQQQHVPSAVGHELPMSAPVCVAVTPQIHSSVAGQNQISPSGVAPSQFEMQATGTHTFKKSCIVTMINVTHTHIHTWTHTHI